MCSEDYLPWIVDLTLAHSPRLRGQEYVVSPTALHCVYILQFKSCLELQLREFHYIK